MRKAGPESTNRTLKKTTRFTAWKVTRTRLTEKTIASTAERFKFCPALNGWPPLTCLMKSCTCTWKTPHSSLFRIIRSWPHDETDMDQDDREDRLGEELADRYVEG